MVYESGRDRKCHVMQYNRKKVKSVSRAVSREDGDSILGRYSLYLDRMNSGKCVATKRKRRSVNGD